jgi:predicted RNase H-like nuclease
VRVLGIDLAWGEGTVTKTANESGTVAIDLSGAVLEAGWTVGVADTVGWVGRWATDETLLLVDAPLLVRNTAGQRACERDVGRYYGRWKVSANSTNLGSRRLDGVALREALEVQGWRYDDGRNGPPTAERVISECYPYTAIVGAHELGFNSERPLYKRKPRRLTTAEFRVVRAAACDGLIAALNGLERADPPLHLGSHPVTEQLVTQLSPIQDRAYKHREDLIDALICAWTGLLWLRHGLERCQLLGLTEDSSSPVATIIAPCRPAQRAPITTAVSRLLSMPAVPSQVANVGEPESNVPGREATTVETRG